jgi:hypothetical protein
MRARLRGALAAPALIAGCLALAAAAPPRAWAQHSPRLSDAPELGVDLILGDEVTSVAAVYQRRVARLTDARLGLGYADPDSGDGDFFVTGGARALAVPRSRRFPVDVAVDGQVGVLFTEETQVSLEGGPSFGLPTGYAGLFVPYGQFLVRYRHQSGLSNVDLGVRIGADYTLSAGADLRGDLVLTNPQQLRAALYVRPRSLLRRRGGVRR